LEEDEGLFKILNTNKAFELFYASALKMERNYFSETLEPIYQSVQLHVQEDSALHSERR
jgi:hypothetical protein